MGSQALFGNSSGTANVASGFDALQANNGDDNVATGFDALTANTSGTANTATGASALLDNTAGSDNVATGLATMKLNTGGYHNVATGNLALMKNKQGHDNSAYGHLALSNATGSRNVAVGSGAGQNLTSGSNNVDIASPGVAGESGTIRIGTASQTAAYLAGVWNKTAGGPTKAVVINKNGRLATAPAPAAPLQGKSQTLSRLRAQNARQSTELRQMRGAIQRLREQVQNGG